MWLEERVSSRLNTFYQQHFSSSIELIYRLIDQFVDLGAIEVYEAAEIVRESADVDANIIFGAVIDETLNDEIRLTVIATGFEEENSKSVLQASEQKAEPKVESVVETKTEETTESKIDPLLDIDRESVNIPSFLRTRK